MIAVLDGLPVGERRRPGRPQGGDEAVAVAAEVAADGLLDVRVDVRRPGRLARRSALNSAITSWRSAMARSALRRLASSVVEELGVELGRPRSLADDRLDLAGGGPPTG
jgi:hypothetical protein